MRWSGTSSTHLRRSVPGYSCRPMSAKMDKTKTDRIATSRSRRTASNKAPTIVFKPTHRRHRRRHGYSPEHSTRTHTRLTALCPGLPGWAGTRKVKPIWILLKQETASGSESAGPYASLHLAPAKCPSCRPTNSVKALKVKMPRAFQFGQKFRFDSAIL